MLRKTLLRHQSSGVAIASVVMLLLASGVAHAQIGTNGGASLLGAPGYVAPGVGPTGIPLGSTETGGGGLSAMPYPTGPTGTGMTGTGALGATELSNGGLSPMPSMPSSPPAPAGMGVPAMTSTGAMLPYGITAPGTAMPGTTGGMTSVGSAFTPIGPGSPTIAPGMQTQGITSIYGTGAMPSPMGPPLGTGNPP